MEHVLGIKQDNTFLDELPIFPQLLPPVSQVNSKYGPYHNVAITSNISKEHWTKVYNMVYNSLVYTGIYILPFFPSC